MSITYDKLKVESKITIKKLRQVYITSTKNEHAKLILEGYIDESENISEYLSTRVIDTEISLYETETNDIIFKGLIQVVKIKTEGKINYLQIEVLSTSILMDRVKKSRSFQKVEMTYEQIALHIVSEYTKGATIATVGENTTLDVPLIQYSETDWEFLRRLTSHFESVIVPETTEIKPRVWFGFPNDTKKIVVDTDAYKIGETDGYYELGGVHSNFESYEFRYIELELYENLVIGDIVTFKKEDYVVYEKHATIKQQILVFTYKIGKTGIKHAPKYYNEIISGMTLLGEVAKTDGENIWIKLDIDEGQGGEYPYTWRPETGNFMYCMPQVGTRVSLYFPNIDEHSGIAINCVRTNGSDCERMQDPNKKAFVTEHGKEMDLYPEELFFNNEDSAIMISDNLGVILSTEFKINIIGPEINFEAPKIVIKAEIQEINLVYYDMVPKLDASGRVDFVIISSLVMLHQFDIKSKNGTILEGREFSAFPAFPELLPDEPKKEPFNWFKWGANIALGGLAVVGIGAAFSVAVTTVVTAVSDVVRGEVTDTKDFLVEIGIAAVCGAVGSLFQGGTMLKEGFIGIAEGVIERMLRGEKIFSLSNMLEDFIMSAAVAGLLDTVGKKLLNNILRLNPCN